MLTLPRLIERLLDEYNEHPHLDIKCLFRRQWPLEEHYNEPQHLNCHDMYYKLQGLARMYGIRWFYSLLLLFRLNNRLHDKFYIVSNSK